VVEPREPEPEALQGDEPDEALVVEGELL